MTRRSFGLSLAASALLRGEKTGESRGREVIDRAINALGGNAFRSMRTRTEDGRAYSFYREQISGLSQSRFYTEYATPAGGKPSISQLQRQFYGKKQEDSVLYTPSGAYELTFRGARPLSVDKEAQYQEATLHDIFYILHQRMNEPGLDFQARGVDVVENQRVETIDVYDAENRNVTVWFNANTFLPVKQSFHHWDAVIKDRREDVTRYTKFRDVSGVMWPHATERERDTEKIFALYADKVAINEALADSFFELPNGIKILKQ
ncbi:MAG TPA: hypothetical protein VG273_24410 [Bryobacteraceae bacterium]|jgi:hypothetical protein|nr:hypothetical protein [Bryobacteraceae bacterium]